MAREKDISYDQMSGNTNVFEASEVPYWTPPLINAFEDKIPQSNGKNQSGFQSSKK